MITALTDPAQLPNQLDDQETFDTKFANYFDSLVERARQENELAANMGIFAAGGAYAFPYVFDSSAVDTDPGVGRLRLSNGDQNAAAAMRMDVQIVGGVDISTVLADLRAVTSSVKGSIKLVKLADPTRWIVYDVLGMSLPTGYRNIAVSMRATSGVNPFRNGDDLIVYIQRNGDSGTVPGATELLGEIDATTPVAGFNFPTVFDSAHDWYFVHFAVTATSPNPNFRAAIGGVFSSSTMYWGGTDASASAESRLVNGGEYISGILQIGDVNSARSKPVMFDGSTRISNANGDARFRGRVQTTQPLSGFQIYNSNSAQFTGNVRVYGVRKA